MVRVSFSCSDGTATLLFEANTGAELVFDDGTTSPLSTLTIRATELTVGESGPLAMPADLPPRSAYTYCLDVTADEAIAAGATSVSFSQPVTLLVEDFLGFPAGAAIPVGYYDRLKAHWVGLENGIVLEIVSITAGLADVDVTGDGLADSGSALSELGITADEREQMATLYTVGTTLQRALLPHFSAVDLNHPLDEDPETPDSEADGEDEKNPDHNCESQNASSILIDSQILGETVPVSGTGISLVYRSDRVRGRAAAYRVNIDAGIPGDPRFLDADAVLKIAGRSIPVEINGQQASVIWDGLDSFGRRVQGDVKGIVAVRHLFERRYRVADGCWSGRNSFGGWSCSATEPSIVRVPVANVAQKKIRLGLFDATALKLGGFSVATHHVLIPETGTVYLRDGRVRRNSPTLRKRQLVPIAGYRPCSTSDCSVDGTPTEEATVHIDEYMPFKIGPDGAIVFSDKHTHQIRKLTPGGALTTVAGVPNPGSSFFDEDEHLTVQGGDTFVTDANRGDGGQAVDALFSRPSGLAFAEAGSIYVADAGDQRIRRIDPDGIITTVAGTSLSCHTTSSTCGDDGPASSAKLYEPRGLAFFPDGTLIIADDGTCRLRRVDHDGFISNLAGDPNCFGVEPAPDGTPAAFASWSSLRNVLVLADGTIVVWTASYEGIDTIDRSGIVHPLASYVFNDPEHLTDADSFPGADDGLAEGPGGFIWAGGNDRIAEIGRDGIISGRAGLVSTPDFTGTIPVSNPGVETHGVAVGPDGTAYATTANDDFFGTSRVSVIREPHEAGAPSGLVTIASEDGRELWVFDETGRHLRTDDEQTGTTLRTFGYDSHGLLTTIMDENDLVTTIERDSQGYATQIVGPYGETTLVDIDDGYLNEVTAADGAHRGFTWLGDTGLMETEIDPRGGLHTFEFDALGRLVSDEDPAGSVQTLTREELSDGTVRVSLTTDEGRTTAYNLRESPNGTVERLTTFPSGLEKEAVSDRLGNTTTTRPDGTAVTAFALPDPRLGAGVLLTSDRAEETPNGLVRHTSELRVPTIENGVLVADHRELEMNGRVTMIDWDGTTRATTTTSPEGRVTQRTDDAHGRPLEVVAPGVEPINYVYDGDGRLESVTQGARVVTSVYGTDGRLESSTDPLNQTTSMTRDAVGRVTTVRRPDSEELHMDYDENGNMISLEPPGRPAHTSGYTPTDLLETYEAPTVGSIPVTTSYAYDGDRRVTEMSLPSGDTVITVYDEAGRIETISSDAGQRSFNYDLVTGQLASIDSPDSETLSFGYDGSLMTSVDFAGPVNGTVITEYNDDFLPLSESINGTLTAFVTRDNDLLLTSVGDLAVDHDPTTGFVTRTTLGSVETTTTYDSFGTVETIAVSGVLDLTYTRDDLGRVKTLTDDGTTTSYTYDEVGRLTDVDVDGDVTSYTYDANGNRLSEATKANTATCEYDDQDRLVSCGNVEYTFTDDGSLSSKTDTKNKLTTLYIYDAFSNLRQVDLPDGRVIEYVIDGQNRRVGKKIDGKLQQGWLYRNQVQIAAETDGNGNVTKRFLYASDSNVPDVAIIAGTSYKIIKDHLGSVRAITTDAGKVIALRSYDGFGNVLIDTNPGLIPFGFAGGLEDLDTGLLRFGARDYDGAVGRWTTKDPIGFQGGDTNVFAYAQSNPTNRKDRNGLCDGCDPEIPDLISQGHNLAEARHQAEDELAHHQESHQAPILSSREQRNAVIHCTASCKIARDFNEPISLAVGQGRETLELIRQPPGNELTDVCNNLEGLRQASGADNCFEQCLGALAASNLTVRADDEYPDWWLAIAPDLAGFVASLFR